MNKTVESASSIIANHYGLNWNGRSLTLKRWGSVGCLSSLFFVLPYKDLVLVDRVDVLAEDEGMRLKLPSFHFNDRMLEQVENDPSRIWFMAVEGELIHIRDRNVERLLSRVRITRVGPDRHCFEQDVLGADVDVRMEYIPGRGKSKRDWWANHLNPRPLPLLKTA